MALHRSSIKKIASSLPIIIGLFFLLWASTAEACDRGNCDEAQTWEAGQGQAQEEPVPAVTPTPTAIPTPTGPFYGIGQPWVDMTDEGYCNGFYPYQTAAAPPALSWPLDSPVLHDGRMFRVGHTGLDFDAALGTAVEAAASGTVVWAGETDFFGNDALVVAVHHGYGWMTLYVHLSTVSVECGQGVQTGNIVGEVGMTGASNFEHLHFELRQGSYSFDPLPQIVN